MSSVRRRQHSIAYRVYMGSMLWRVRRYWWYRLSSKRCEGCGCPLALHRRDAAPGERVVTVHHVTYVRLGHERRADVRLLCWPCHQREQLLATVRTVRGR